MTTTLRTMGLPDHWQDGHLSPVFEERTSWDLDVEGHVPPALDGIVVRNGPNAAPVPVGSGFHPWTADGMVHGVRLRDGHALWYRNRWVRTEAIAGKVGVDPAPGPPDVDRTRSWADNTSNTNVVVHGGRILSLCETGLPYELDRCLETVARWDFDGRLHASMCAHPKIDPETGDLVFISFSPVQPRLQCHVAGAGGELRRTVEIDVPGTSLMHDMGMTEHFILVFDQPVVYDAQYAREAAFPFAWDDDYGSRIGVLPKRAEDGPIRWFDVEPGYFIHLLNAYEEGDEIVIDAPRYARTLVRGTTDPRKQASRSALHRYRLDLRTGRATEQQLDDLFFDFPQVAGAVVGRPYRRGFGIVARQEGPLQRFGGIVRYDMDRGTRAIHDVGGSRSASETCFVPDPDDDGEDAGWLLSFVYDWALDRSDLVIVDARRFEDPAVAVVHLPARVPYGFHGTWIPSS